MSRKTKGFPHHATELYCSNRHESPFFVGEEPQKILKVWRMVKAFFCKHCGPYKIVSGVLSPKEIAEHKFKIKNSNVKTPKVKIIK